MYLAEEALDRLDGHADLAVEHLPNHVLHLVVHDLVRVHHALVLVRGRAANAALNTVSPGKPDWAEGASGTIKYRSRGIAMAQQPQEDSGWW